MENYNVAAADESVTTPSTNPPLNTHRSEECRVLTVGEGDLSLSLALIRAYNYCPVSRGYRDHPNSHLSWTVTTWLSEAQVRSVHFDTGPRVLAELQHLAESAPSGKIRIRFGVDATQLERHFPQETFHLILFHHPHLGEGEPKEPPPDHDDDEKEASREQELARRHYILLAHYLHSARSCLAAPGGQVHVALRPLQATWWKLTKAATAAGLVLSNTVPVTRPFHDTVCKRTTTPPPLEKEKEGPPNGGHPARPPDSWTPPPTEDSPLGVVPPWVPLAEPPRSWAASRRSRNARTSHRHWLGRYGYQHQRTWGSRPSSSSTSLDTSGSWHYLFRPLLLLIRGGEETVDAAASSSSLSSSSSSASSSSLSPKVAANVGQQVDSDAKYPCAICGLVLSSWPEWQAHQRAPALPSRPPTETIPPHRAEETVTPATSVPSLGTGSTPASPDLSSSPPATTATDVSAAASGHGDLFPGIGPPEGYLHSTVAKQHSGKRLRWYLQHCVYNPADPHGRHSLKRSKRECETYIAQGRVWVNGAVVQDSGRCLQEGHQVACPSSCTDAEGAASDADPSTLVVVEIVDRWPCGAGVVVVWKPVGMRTVGKFVQSTLEQVVSRQLGHPYQSLSRMDTGCSGLCVLRRVDDDDDDDRPSSSSDQEEIRHLQLVHTYAALVHGRVPADWCQAAGCAMLVNTQGLRRWGQNKTASLASTKSTLFVDNKDNVNESTNQDEIIAGEDNNMFVTATFRCIEQTEWWKDPERDAVMTPDLATVTITTASSVGGMASILAHHLRKVVKCAVVGDRFATREYLSLPRSMRNRLKQRWCLGCIRVEKMASLLGDQTSPPALTERPLFEKWRATYWQQHLRPARPSLAAPSTVLTDSTEEKDLIQSSSSS